MATVSELKPGKEYIVSIGNDTLKPGDRVWMDLDGYLHSAMLSSPWKMIPQTTGFLTPKDIEDGATTGVVFKRPKGAKT